MSLSLELGALEIARGEVEGWRGRCLDLFANGEREIGAALETLRHSGKTSEAVKLQHLAGQRAAELGAHVSSSELTAKQKSAVQVALDGWQAHDHRRSFLAHGTASIAIDDHGGWWAIFDMTVYRKDRAEFERWALSRAEAGQFQDQLECGFVKLAQQTGHLRKNYLA